jgi:Domain of unknown function (DUF4189)
VWKALLLFRLIGLALGLFATSAYVRADCMSECMGNYGCGPSSSNESKCLGQISSCTRECLAENSYCAIAYSPSTEASGMSQDYASRSEAEDVALRYCRRKRTIVKSKSGFRIDAALSPPAKMMLSPGVSIISKGKRATSPTANAVRRAAKTARSRCRIARSISNLCDQSSCRLITSDSVGCERNDLNFHFHVAIESSRSLLDLTAMKRSNRRSVRSNQFRAVRVQLPLSRDRRSHSAAQRSAKKWRQQ